MNLLRLAIVPKKKKGNRAKIETGFCEKEWPNQTHFHVHGDSQIFFLFLLYFGPSPFLAIHYSLTEKKKNNVVCGYVLWGF